MKLQTKVVEEAGRCGLGGDRGLRVGGSYLRGGSRVTSLLSVSAREGSGDGAFGGGATVGSYPSLCGSELIWRTLHDQ